MTTHLKDIQPLYEYSYLPEQVRRMEEKGMIIIDIIRAPDHSPDLKSWVKHFRDRMWPIFAELTDKKEGNGLNFTVKLWCKRVVLDDQSIQSEE